MNGLSPAPQLAVARNVVTSATNPATPATHQRPMRMPTTAAAAATSTVVIAGKLTGCKFGAGDGNRTHVTSLEGSRFEQPAQISFSSYTWPVDSADLERQPPSV